MPNFQERMKKQVDSAKSQLEMEVEAACLETQEQAKDIAKAIGEISIDEAKEAIASIFREKLFCKRYYAEFQGKKP